jgi:hypothetical protein
LSQVLVPDAPDHLGLEISLVLDTALFEEALRPAAQGPTQPIGKGNSKPLLGSVRQGLGYVALENLPKEPLALTIPEQQ